MLFPIAVFLSILKQATDTKIFTENQPQFDLSIPLDVKSQFSELSVIVFCFDNGTGNSWLIQHLMKNNNFNMLLVNYGKYGTYSVPENNVYFYVLFFHNISNLGHFMDHLSYKIHVLLILSLNGIENVGKVSKKVCPILNLYIFNLSTSRLMVCDQGLDETGTIKTLKFEGAGVPQLRNIVDFKGRKFVVGTTSFPTRLEYR